MSWAEHQEFKENRHTFVLLACGLATMAALVGWDVIANWRPIVAELAFDWNGLIATSKLIQPVILFGLSILHFKLGLNRRG